MKDIPTYNMETTLSFHDVRGNILFIPNKNISAIDISEEYEFKEDDNNETNGRDE